jgi:cyclin B
MKADSVIFNLARYLIELSLVNYRMTRFSQSNIASAALYLALKMTKHSQPWNETISKHSLFKESDIRPCAKELFILL